MFKRVSQDHFMISLLLVLAAPWLAPLFAALGGKPFSAADWTLFAVMFQFSLAASTRSLVVGVIALISASVAAAIYAGQPDSSPLTPGRFGLVYVPLALFMLAQAVERYKMHWEREEPFW